VQLGNWTKDKPNYNNISADYANDTATFYTMAQTNATIDAKINTTLFYPFNSSVSGGSYTDRNNISDAWYEDAFSHNFSESNGVDPLDVYFNFTNITTFNRVFIREYYTGSASHDIQLQLWNYGSSNWETYLTIVGQTGFNELTLDEHSPSGHINGGIVQFRFHHLGNGASTHRLYVDYIQLVQGLSGSASPNLDGYAKYSFGYENFTGNGNFVTTGIINGTHYGDGILNNLNMTNILTIPNDVKQCVGSSCQTYIMYNSTGNYGELG
jgi:hypothetical protein